MAIGKKYGGRVAGTPNKTTGAVRAAISKMLDGYFNSEDFEKDIKALKPKERVEAMEKFAAYVAPKLQSTTLEATIEGKKTIEDKLLSLSGSED